MDEHVRESRESARAKYIPFSLRVTEKCTEDF